MNTPTPFEQRRPTTPHGGQGDPTPSEHSDSSSEFTDSSSGGFTGSSYTGAWAHSGQCPSDSEPRYGQRIPGAGQPGPAYGQQARPGFSQQRPSSTSQPSGYPRSGSTGWSGAGSAPTGWDSTARPASNSFTNGRGGLTNTARSMWRQAPVTVGIIVAAVVFFGLQQVMPGLTRMLGFSPVEALTEPWRFLTTAFLHGSLMHLAFNMWALWAIGSSLEPYLGRARYALLFILSAVGGSTAIYMLASPMSRDWLTLTVGASGAVFGMFAAVFVIQRRMGRDTTSIIMLLLVNAAISLFGTGISWQGHLGGFLTGLAISSIYAWAPWELKTKGIVASAGVAIALAAMIALKVFLIV